MTAPESRREPHPSGARRWWLRLVFVGCFATLGGWLVIAWTPIAGLLMRGWVRQDSVPAERLGAVVVLSGGLTSSGNLNVYSTERLLTGLEWIRSGAAPLLLTTRVVDKRFAGRAMRDSDQRRLVALAGAESEWAVVGDARSTREEAVRTSEYLTPRGVRRILLVTSPSHTRRACAAFEAMGFAVVCRAARERGRDTWHPKNADDRLAAFRAYGYERLAMIEYGAKGWLVR